MDLEAWFLACYGYCRAPVSSESQLRFDCTGILREE